MRAAARETGHVPTLLFALSLHCAHSYLLRRRYGSDRAPRGMHRFGAGKGAVHEVVSPPVSEVAYWPIPAKHLTQSKQSATEITELRPIGATVWRTAWLAHLSLAYAELGKLDDAWRCIGEAITAVETTKEGGTKPRSIASPAKSR